MKQLKIIAVLAFLLNTFLFGSYYSIAKEALERIDPIVFTFLTMMTLLPPALCLLAFSWRHLTREVVKSGFLLGSCLCLGLFTLAVALKYNSATGTAFFPSLNGLLAAIFTWFFLRQRITKSTWFAGAISVVGAGLLMANASMGGSRGALIAFIGGLFCTFYVFLADREQKDPASYWALLGIELLTMAVWANLITLLFGDWQNLRFSMPNDLWTVLYVGLGTIFLPTLFTVLLQRYISPITVSFIYILEPIFGTLVAFFYLHEHLPLDGYLGGALVVVGMIIHSWGSIERPAQRQQVQRQLSLTNEQVQTSWFRALVLPMVCCILGVFLVYRFGGFPPAGWLTLYQSIHTLPVLVQQGHMFRFVLLLGQALSWLIAWCALVGLGGLAIYRTLHKLRTLSSPQVDFDLDIHALRQMGYSAYGLSAVRQREHRDVVEKRRKNRSYRLANAGKSNDAFALTKQGRYESSQLQQPQARPQPSSETFYDAFGNSWSWWDDSDTMEMRK
jgi:drug/metabolite transporter (DMT)-like permease